MGKEQSNKQIGRIMLNILSQFGSKGLPSCGRTDAGRIGQGTGGNEYIGGSEEEISEGTPIYNLPFWLLGRYLPDKLSKSPRNMEQFLKRKRKK
jgi:hypothetical protein